MKFTTPPNKNYRKDIEILKLTLENNENITFSKFCDGELSILINKETNNNEFFFDPHDPSDIDQRLLLLESFKYKNPRYFVGITCVSIFGLDTHRYMKSICKQPECNLTWADLFVNSNYTYYVENIIPIFQKRNIILVCNENGKIENLPFKPKFVFKVGDSALKYNLNIIDDIKRLIIDNALTNYIFLFCCGPLGNVLSHQLTLFNENNSYLDVGSTLNPYLQSEKFRRDYYINSTNFFANHIGVWDNSMEYNYE